MITVAEAESLINQSLPKPRVIKKPLAEALGYCLAESIAAERDYPPFDRITHDGIALFTGSLLGGRRNFPVVGYAAAGDNRKTLADTDHCIEAATGAPLPENCDSVVPYEMLHMLDGIATIKENAVIRPGDCLHKRGSDKKAGEPLLERSQKIGIQEIAILASNGISEVPVYARPAIGILATGNELAETDGPVQPFQIRRSNDIALKSALALNGFPDVQTLAVGDDKDCIRGAIGKWLEENKVVLVTGGVSRGKYDYVPDALKELGVRRIFHHVAQRPGKPLLFCLAGNGNPIFGLPGNPASCLTCLIRYVVPALRRMAGEEAGAKRQIALGEPAHPLETLTLLRAVCFQGETNYAVPVITNNSGDFIGLQGTDGFVELPPREGVYATGEKVAFYPWSPA